MNKYVTSLELSKKLKEAGAIPQGKTLFLWYDGDIYLRGNTPKVSHYRTSKDFSAPMTDELLEILPSNIHLNRNENKRSKSADYRLIIKKSDKYFLVSYNDIVEDIFVISICDDKSLPNAIAKLALELKEQDLL